MSRGIPLRTKLKGRLERRGEGGSTIRIGTYNVLDGGGDRWRQQVQFLAGLHLDVLGIQEAKHWDARGCHRMFATARALGMQPLFAPSRHHGCHLVTLYRWPKVECTAFEPDVSGGEFHHTASRARFTAGGRAFSVVHTHLDPFSGQDRLSEVSWLTQYAAADEHTALIGDLNSIGAQDREQDDWRRIPIHLQPRHRMVRDDGSYGGTDRRAMAALMAAGFVDPPLQLQVPWGRTAGYWNDTELWDHRSDYVLLSPSLAPALRSYVVADTPTTQMLSDHLPVVATLHLDAL
ncbi:endonuclease/exonuclease/phosphatase family protein [Streptomyces sp. RTd22]|uniref:endonuclease/exonuclease/phosphatase family protein n=1 Tax=Streptomyces sp. RTd22 TaxID=1841249 RepID=UPI000A4FA382|nr:endonuclease/exonuclease/phosphatase family protein [Streptomyces sp. RTd22]